ncbi:MAG: MBL fold metallo-hydrolase [Rikenellaceae bacterium]
MIEIVILADNRPTPTKSPIKIEHGLSIYIEFDDLRILCDMGASNLYAKNGELMGVDLNDLDFAFVSHAHADHTGGLRYLLENHTCDVYLSDKIRDHKFHSSRGGARRDISHDNTLFKQYPDRLEEIEESCWIGDKVAIVTNFMKKYPQPQGNAHLTCDNAHDDFAHEMALVLDTEEGVVIISPCTHSGAANVIESCREFTGKQDVVAFIGGLHFVDHPKGTTTGYDEVLQFTRTVARIAPDTQIITGHCTASEAENALLTLFNPDDLQFFHSGAIIEL